jgi:hypothetical protein
MLKSHPKQDLGMKYPESLLHLTSESEFRNQNS